MKPDYQLAICGAGPVGLALAALLLRNGVPGSSLLILDGKTAAAAISDPRSIALSWGSRQILERLSAWPAGTDAIREIHVSRRGHFGRAMMRASELDVPELGYVCRYGQVVDRLEKALANSGVQVMRPMMLADTAEHEDSVELKLDNGLVFSADLLVQAEGGVFGAQSARARMRDYQQSAIISHVVASDMPPARAYERFTDEGPLALLPQEGGYALVWCMRGERAQNMMQLDDAAFLQALQDAFGQRVGRFTRLSRRHVFRLGLNAHEAQTRRTVAIGNAAQTLHPVAGQGLNLGLRDATVLAGLLAHAPSPDSLARFSSERRADRRLTIRLTDTMARAFTAPLGAGPVQSLIAGSLGLIDMIRPAKRSLAEQMMYGWR